MIHKHGVQHSKHGVYASLSSSMQPGHALARPGLTTPRIRHARPRLADTNSRQLTPMKFLSDQADLSWHLHAKAITYKL